MKNPTVKPAEAEDISWISELAKSKPFAAAWSFEAFGHELGRPDRLLLVSEPRGYILARLVDDDCLLLDIAVAEDGKGVGRALFKALKDAAKTRACRKISFEVSAANERALAFYAAAGAAVVGRRKKFYNDGSDAVLMDLNLK